MSCRIQMLLFSLGLFFLTSFAQTGSTQTPDSAAKSSSAHGDSARQNVAPTKAAPPDTTSVFKWIEDHAVLLGSIIIPLLALIWGLATGQISLPKIKEWLAGRQIEKLYLESIQAEHDTIHLYGFQSTANLKVRTLEVFVSLRFEEYGRGEMAAEDSRHSSPEEVLQRAFRKQRLLLIIGDAGSGKTILLKYYAMCCLDAPGRQKLGLTRPLIPILLPLRKIENSKLPFCEALSQWATRKNRPVSKDTFEQWLRKRGCLVMLDGLDEISNVKKRKQICEWIDDACNTFSQSLFVVTSRYTGYRVSEGIELHTDHLRADVLDLNAEQQETFLKKWFTAAYKDEREAAELSVGERDKEIAAAAQEVANGVLNYLTRAENAGLRAIAGTPVLLQIMAILWKEYHNLPPGRAALYEKCTDYLLDHRDRQKDIAPLLPTDEAKIVLRPLCLWMQEVHKSDEVTAAALEKQIAKRLAEVTLGQELEKVPPLKRPRAFIENLRNRAGILQDFGDGDYIFRHKSFREFLAATQLADEVQRRSQRAKILVENFNDGWWRETLLFSLSLPKPSIFNDFFTHFLPHAHNAAGFPPLLEQMVREARHKPVDAFAKFFGEAKYDWQKRYNALLCLRLIASEPAKALVQKVWVQEKEPRVKQKAEEILIEWKLRRPEVPPAAAPSKEIRLREAHGPEAKSVAEQETPNRIRNPLELNAEYILIPGGKYNYSVTKKETVVPPRYFAKYPVTNKLYRRFIDYLARKENMREVLAILPPEEFAQSLLAQVKSNSEFVGHLKQDAKQWTYKLRSIYDEEKRFNGEDQPVAGVTWFAAQAYCHWLTEMQRAEGYDLSLKVIKGKSGQSEKLIYKLPNEEEWEWAASGGKREYPWGKEEPDETRANYGSNVGQTTPVGAYPAGATPEGLMDMAGNVWEWMENLYGEGAYREDARALRGESWASTDARALRCAARFLNVSGVRNVRFGFRVVCGQS